VLPFGRLWYGEPNAVANAIGYAEHYSRSHDTVIRGYDKARNVIETHEHAGDLLSLQAQAEKRRRREDFHLLGADSLTPAPNDLGAGGVLTVFDVIGWFVHCLYQEMVISPSLLVVFPPAVENTPVAVATMNDEPPPPPRWGAASLPSGGRNRLQVAV
jgi:hypothetical protein